MLLSVGGSTEIPYSGDASAYGRTAANWAHNNGLDGVDFDLEKIKTGEANQYAVIARLVSMVQRVAGFVSGSLTSQALVAWIVAASVAARRVLGGGVCGGIITHAPQV